MAKVIWNGTVIAESNNTIVIEGKKYFPHHAVKQNYFFAVLIRISNTFIVHILFT